MANILIAVGTILLIVGVIMRLTQPKAVEVVQSLDAAGNELNAMTITFILSHK
jgi:hypothetical protein